MKFRTYIFLPESDDDFIRIGQNSDAYETITREISVVREIVKIYGGEFWFDSVNFSNFSKLLMVHTFLTFQVYFGELLVLQPEI